MAEQAARCLDLRLKGSTIQQIADVVGLARSTVYKRLETAMSELVTPKAEEQRKIELARLDQLQGRAWKVLDARHPLVQGGRVVTREMADGTVVEMSDAGPVLGAIDRLLRISERRARLLGLDMPTQVQVTPPPDPAEIELSAMVREAKARMAVEEAAIRRGDA